MILKCAACGYCYEPNPSSNANLDYCPKCGGGRWFIKPGDPELPNPLVEIAARSSFEFEQPLDRWNAVWVIVRVDTGPAARYQTRP